MEEELLSSKRLDHLGIVAGICEQIDLVEQIDGYVGPTERRVTVGEATEAMVLNALGFVGRALYLTPEFFQNKPVDILIREGLQAEDLNDDTLGRALDKLYEAGVTEVFGQVASHALGVLGIAHTFYHLDSTTFSFSGAYDSEGYEGIQITHGYSKDHRPDLKQAVVSLICSYQSALPVWFEALDGNSCDKKTFPKTIQAYVGQMKGGATPYFIADSALYTAENLGELSQVTWLTRVPGSIKEVQELYEVGLDELIACERLEGYFCQEVYSEYGGVQQRWVLVFSEQAYAREQQGVARQIPQEKERVEKQLWHLGHQEFATSAEAESAVEELQQQWKFHRVVFALQEVPHYPRRGRPKQGEEPKVCWRVEGEVEEDADKVMRELGRKGKFVLATNELASDKLSAEQLLAAYKSQGASVERGFRFLKDPLFFAQSLFLERPERIMALLMVMGLALLVYALAEHKLRGELRRKGESLPNQVGKPTQRPTMRRIFQVFEGIDVLVVKESTRESRMVLNLKPMHRKILHLLGPEVQKCYFLDG